MPFFNTIVLSPLLRSENKGAGGLSGSETRQKNIQKFRTAQLHIQRTQSTTLFSGEERTPATKKGMLRLFFLPAVLSVEAALTLPVFVAAMCILMYPLLVLDAQAEAQGKLEQTLELITVGEGVRRSFIVAGRALPERSGTTDPELLENGVPETDLDPSGLLGGMELAAGGASILTAFDKNIFYVQALPEVSLPTDDEPVAQLHATVFVRFPFMTQDRGGGISGFLCPVKLVSSRRAWTGRKGGSGRSYAGSSGAADAESNKEDRTVFVARNSASSGVYHLSEDCSYIRNHMRTAEASQVGEIRNADGGKYHACPSCRPGSEGTVYLFERGDAYHASPDCKAIISYAVAMKESEATEKGLVPCSRCRQNH